MRIRPVNQILTFLLAFLMLFSSSTTVFAAGKNATGENTGYIRAKLEYEYDAGVTGLDDSVIKFADGWKKTGDWYYYDKSVKPGDKVRFMTGVNVPADWTEAIQNKAFAVIVTVEASEVAPGAEGWGKNTEILYSEKFSVWDVGFKRDDDVVIKEGKLTVDIHEYQLDKNGKEVPYVNDKIIVPGQPISKIVEFELGGKLGKTTLREIIKTGQNTFLLMGIVGLGLMAGGGYVLYKRKKEGAAK